LVRQEMNPTAAVAAADSPLEDLST